jgi:hypothetical protein
MARIESNEKTPRMRRSSMISKEGRKAGRCGTRERGKGGKIRKAKKEGCEECAV